MRTSGLHLLILAQAAPTLEQLEQRKNSLLSALSRDRCSGKTYPSPSVCTPWPGPGGGDPSRC
eukprot:2442064-Rhodomonas_salina.2